MKRIIVYQRSDDFHARIESDSSCWDRGSTPAEAIGNLMLSHPEKFNIEIQNQPLNREMGVTSRGANE